jgi:predicted RNA-binding Zn ribbon-like protein
MPPESSPATKPFELIAGHPALDFINTLDDRFASPPSGPQERLVTYEDLLRFTQQAGLLTDRQARKLKRLAAHPESDPGSGPDPIEAQPDPAAVLHQAIQLREALATLTYAWLEASPASPPPQPIALLEDLFKQAALHRRLKPEAGHLLWSWKGLSRHLASPLWLLAQSANDLLTSDDILRLRSCASDTCRWVFLDTSKNHTRRWCDMKTCGNRNKVRRFHARQADPA